MDGQKVLPIVSTITTVTQTTTISIVIWNLQTKVQNKCSSSTVTEIDLMVGGRIGGID